MTGDDFDRRILELPEPKLELLDGLLTVGNGAGNMQLLRHVLDGWGAEAAVPMAPEERWRQALYQGFRRLDPPMPEKPADVWHAWAAQGELRVLDLLWRVRCGTTSTPRARAVADGSVRLLSRRNTAISRSGGTRDVVMRLGQDAFTPDVFAVSPTHRHLLNDHYLNGPGDLVIEILLRGHEAYDREVKRRRYEVGVGEYWIIDPVRRKTEFLRLGDDGFRPSDPRRGWEISPSKASSDWPSSYWPLWEGNSWGHGAENLFAIETDAKCPSAKRAGGRRGRAIWPSTRGRNSSHCRLLRRVHFRGLRAKFEPIDGKPWPMAARLAQRHRFATEASKRWRRRTVLHLSKGRALALCGAGAGRRP